MANENSQSRDWVAQLLGVAVVIAFGAFVVYLLANLDLEENEWTRAVFLLAGVEAVAFAAAGYFFGTQVQRGKVEEAQREAQTAEQVKDAAVESAAAEKRNHQNLAEGVVQVLEGQAAAAGPGGMAGGGAAGTPQDPAAELLLSQARRALDR